MSKGVPNPCIGHRNCGQNVGCGDILKKIYWHGIESSKPRKTIRKQIARIQPKRKDE